MPLEILSQWFTPIEPSTGYSRHRCRGVYLLILDDRIIYVGASADVAVRLVDQQRGKRGGIDSASCAKKFGRALCLEVPPLRLAAVEGALIRALDPCLNGNSPKHLGDDNEILEELGLPPHADERKNARAYLAKKLIEQANNAWAREVMGGRLTRRRLPRDCSDETLDRVEAGLPVTGAP